MDDESGRDSFQSSRHSEGILQSSALNSNAYSHRSTLLGNAPKLSILKKNKKAKQNNSNNLDGDFNNSGNFIRGATFWYIFRRLFPIVSTTTLILGFLIPNHTSPHDVDGFLLSGSLISLILTALAIASYYHISPWRRHPSDIILHRVVSSVLFTGVLLTYAISNFSNRHQNRHDIAPTELVSINADSRDHSSSCQASSMITQYSAFSGELWVFMLSIDLYFSLTNPFTSYKVNLRRYNIITTILSLLFSMSLLGGSSCQGIFFKNGLCWIKTSGPWSSCLWGYFLAWCSFFYLFAISMVLFAFTRLSTGLEVTYATRKACVMDTFRVVYYYMSYALLLVVIYIMLSSISYEGLLGRFLERAVVYVVSCRGAVDALVWFYLHDFNRDPSSIFLVDKIMDFIYYPLYQLQFFKNPFNQTNANDTQGYEPVENPQNNTIPVDPRAHLPRVSTSTSSSTLFSEQHIVDPESPLTIGLLAQASLGSGSPLDVASTWKNPVAGNNNVNYNIRSGNEEEDDEYIDIDLSPQLNMALRAELLHYVSSGIYMSVHRTHDREDAEEKRLAEETRLLSESITRSTSSVDNLLTIKLHNSNDADAMTTTPMTRNSRNSQVQSQQKYSTSSETLNARTDSQANTPMSPRITQSNRRRRSSVSHTIRYSVNRMVSKVAESLGILQEAEAFAEVHPKEDEFMVEGKYLFKDHRPGQFRALRELVGIDEEAYLDLIQQPTKETLAEGSSGAFMFYCGNGQLVVKTVSKEESKTLLHILDRYTEHLRHNPDSLIVRFLGLHSLTMFHTEFNFVVMKSIFPASAQINERYDVKGSWVDRNAKQYPPGKRTSCRFCGELFVVGTQSRCPVIVGPHEANVVFKDNDLTSKIRLLPEDAFHVIDTLTRDSDALFAMGIMDYSLLLGIQNQQYDVHSGNIIGSGNSTANNVNAPASTQRARNNLNKSFTNVASIQTQSMQQLQQIQMQQAHRSLVVPSTASEFLSTANGTVGEGVSLITLGEGGFPARAVVAPVGYYFGIIDILQTWSLQKKAEHFWKTNVMRLSKSGISCIDPSGYRKRFQQKVSRIIEHAVFVREVTGSWMGRREVSEPVMILGSGNTANGRFESRSSFSEGPTIKAAGTD